MLPLFVVATVHLRLKEASELSLYGPAYTVSLLVSALNYVLAVREYVSIDPYALFEDQNGYLLRHLIFFSLSALYDAPEPLTTAVRMLA